MVFEGAVPAVPAACSSSRSAAAPIPASFSRRAGWTPIWTRCLSPPRARSAPRDRGGRGGLRVPGRPMNRLVQGDVGSGKTVVAAALCALAAQNGWQAASWRQTEILAVQHAETLAPAGPAGHFLHPAHRLDDRGAEAVRARRNRNRRGAGRGAARARYIQQGVAFHRLGAVIADKSSAASAWHSAPRFRPRGKRRMCWSCGYAHSAHARANYSTATWTYPCWTSCRPASIRSRARGGGLCAPHIAAFIDKQIAAGGQAYVVCPAGQGGRIKPQKRGAAPQRTCRPPCRTAALPCCTAA